MKLLYVINTINGAGGIQRVVLLKAAYFAEKLGYDVSVLITNDDTRKLHYDVHPAIKLLSITPKNGNLFVYFRSYKRLLNEAITREDPDVVVMCDNGTKSFLFPFIATGKAPVVYERHITKFVVEDGDLFYKRWGFLKKFLFRFMEYSASRFDKFVVVTEDARQEWRGSNLTIISNPLWFKSDILIKPEHKKIVAVGRHVYQKGFDRMLKIWEEAGKQCPGWTLDIYGESNPDFNLRAMAVDGQIPAIRFFKPVKDIISVYEEASICLMTSRYEGFGMVLLEAMECGVPCIAFDCPVGPVHIIDDAVNGFLVPDNDINAFTSRLIQLVKDAELRSEMGKAAKTKAASFNIDVIMKQWDSLFKALIAGKNS